MNDFTIVNLQDLATATGLTETDFLAIGQGDKALTKATIQQVGAFLGVSASVVIGDKDTAPTEPSFAFAEAGVYPEWGNVEITGNLGILIFDGTNFSKTEINFVATGIVEEGNEEAVSGGEVFEKTMIKDVFVHEVSGKNKFNKNDFLNNKTLSSTGVILDSPDSKVSNYIPVKANTSYVVSGGFSANSNHRVSFFQNINDTTPHTYYNSYWFTTPNIDGYVVIWIAVPTADISDTLQLEQGNTATTYEPFSEEELIKEEYLPNYLKESDLKIGTGVNLFNKNGDFIEDLALGSDGSLQPAPGALIVDILIENNENTITLQGYKTDGNNHRICFLDENKHIISGSIELFTVEPYFATEIPNLAKFVRIWFKHQNDDIDVLDTFMVSYGSYLPEYVPFQKGLKGVSGYPIVYENTNPVTRFTLLNMTGDSIVYGYSMYGQPRLYDYFAKMVARNIGAGLNNYGISGSTIARNSSLPTDRDPIVDRLTDLDLNADIICVAGGTNDWAHNWTPFGEYNDTVPTTFCGALNIICEYLLKNFVGKTVFFSTPIHRLDSDANPQDKTLKDYADAIIDIAGEWGIPVVDCYRNVSIIPTLPEHSVLIPDETHPSIEGHRMMANVITGFIKTL